MEDYPNSWHNYIGEISLPVYYNLTDEDIERVAQAVKTAVNSVIKHS